MSDSTSSLIRRIVSKMDVNLTEQDAVDAFWDRCVPGTRQNMGDKQAEHIERDIKKAFREHQKTTGRMALDMVA
jgi:hypothetical protein